MNTPIRNILAVTGRVRVRSGHLNMLDLLRRSDPKLVMVFVEKEELENGEYEECLVADPQKEWHPVDLAWQVLDHLDSRLSASLSNYPRANPLQ